MLSYRDCTTLYVSPDGTGNGKYPDEVFPGCGPMGSIAAALDAIDMMRGGGMLQPITVCLRAGTYCLTAPLTLRPTMSNVTVRPYGDGEVTVSGGRKITGFVPTVFNGVPCLGAHIPQAADGSWRFTDLWVNGLHADKTRLPANGYFRMKETENPTTELFGPSAWFTAEEGDLAQFASLYAFEDTIVSFNHYWIDEHTPVTSLDRETGRVTMTYRSRFNIRPGQEYILENVAEQFTAPGQWYLDRAGGMLYYIPRDDSETAESIEVWAPVSDKLLVIAGQPDNHITGLRFVGLTFAHTRGDYASGRDVNGASGEAFGSDAQAVSNAHGAIELQYARNVMFTDCKIQNYGVHGVNIREGCRSVKIDGCDIYDGGAGGVRICGGGWGAPAHTMTRGITVTDCSITHVGQRYYSACGVLLMHASECEISHNEIGDLYYTGVSVGWTWGYAKTVCRDNRITDNHIYDLGKGFLSDMGGVYLLGSQPGTVVSGNVIHDIRCKEYGGWALYTDEGSAGILLENNLCYNTSSNSYHQHYGSSNVVRNNIFALADDNMLRVSRAEPHLSILFRGNIVLSKGTPMLAEYGMPLEEGAIVSNRNLFWNTHGDVTYSTQATLPTLEAAQAAGMEEDSVIADPGFAIKDEAAPVRADFILPPYSPAFRIGFVPYDHSRSGRRRR
ncbi:MAG: right-handed parallel beta-helix repeat-containing protein [Clostridia bacterium]|nr:right-handed parallel beta-helix repeat-containing protein [Clostridia bacterium]